MASAQRRDTGEIDNGCRLATPAAHELLAFNNNAVAQLMMRRQDSGEWLTGAQSVRDCACVIIIDGDNRAISTRKASFLNRRVGRHRAVAIEVIRREVQKHADRWR